MAVTNSTIYPKDSIGLKCTVKINGAEIVTTYTAGEIANNDAVGKGKIWVTVYDSDGHIVQNAVGVTLENVYMNVLTTHSGQFVYTIAPGLLNPGVYKAHPFFGIRDSGGQLLWRKQDIITITVAELSATADVPVE